MSTRSTPSARDWALSCFQDHGKTACAAIIRSVDGQIDSVSIPTGNASGKPDNARPVFLDALAED